MIAPALLDPLVARLDALAAGRSRTVVGVVGAPGAGKSTLTAALAGALGQERCVVVPMDGFHLARSVIAGTPLAGRRGAPDTFDPAGFVALLGRLRDPDGTTVYAPEFVRGLEEPIAGAIAVPPALPIVLTEGNYLLLDTEPWNRIAGLLDECWFVETPEDLRVERLIARHVAAGMAPDAARDWALGTDARNAELVAATAGRASRRIPLG